MTKEDFKALRRGDIVQSMLSGISYVVMETDGIRAMVIRTLEIKTPEDWILFAKSELVEKGGKG